MASGGKKESPQPAETSGIGRAWRVGSLLSVALVVFSFAADAMDVIDKIQSGFFGKPMDTLIRNRYEPAEIATARKALFLDRYARICFASQENAGSLEVGQQYRIDVFRCGDALLAARVEDSDGHVVLSEIDLPEAPTKDVDHAAGAALASDLLLAQSSALASTQHITRALCQRVEPRGLVIRYQLADGRCMDELVDRRTGAMIERTLDVPCDCSSFQ